MKKKVVLLATLLMLCVGLVACGDDSSSSRRKDRDRDKDKDKVTESLLNDNDKESDPTNTATPQPTNTATPTPTPTIDAEKLNEARTQVILTEAYEKVFDNLKKGVINASDSNYTIKDTILLSRFEERYKDNPNYGVYVAMIGDMDANVKASFYKSAFNLLEINNITIEKQNNGYYLVSAFITNKDAIGGMADACQVILDEINNSDFADMGESALEGAIDGFFSGEGFGRITGIIKGAAAGAGKNVIKNSILNAIKSANGKYAVSIAQVFAKAMEQDKTPSGYTVAFYATTNDLGNYIIPNQIYIRTKDGQYKQLNEDTWKTTLVSMLLGYPTVKW